LGARKCAFYVVKEDTWRARAVAALERAMRWGRDPMMVH
jgi:hypothetical protein